MPGTPEEYVQSEDFSRAADLIDQQIQGGEASGASILSLLQDEGLRVYTEGSVEGAEEGPEMEEIIPGEEEMPEEMAEEPLLDEELAAMGPGPSMIGGPEGGGREDLLSAVRFGMGADKENKKKKQAEQEQY